MNRLELVNLCKRKTKDTSSTSNSGFQDDLDTALGIVDSILNTHEGDKAGTLSIISGTGTYAVDSDVETINQILITSLNNEKQLVNIDKDEFRASHPNTSDDSTGNPSYWYESDPTINSTTNAQTKNISIYPIPNANLTASYTYTRSLPAMATDAASPSFNAKYHHILADYAIWQYYERETDESGNPMYWQSKWNQDLAWLIETYPKITKYPVAIPGPDYYEVD